MPGTDKYPARNQLLGNLEVAGEYAQGKHFAVLVTVEEDGPDPVDNREIAAGLPHLTPAHRREVMEHYLGRITWRRMCAATGLEFAQLPQEALR